MQRVAVYIDGFNLYYGLKSKREGRRGKRWPCYYWLDVRRMSETILRRHQQLTLVRYFTARVHYDENNPGKVHRQNLYIEALSTLPDVVIHEGYFVEKGRTCRRCGSTYKDYEEKMTDVNIAMELLGDAYDDRFDTAMIVSADGDLAGPVAEIQRRYPSKRVIMAFPPDRVSVRIKDVANGYFSLGRNVMRSSQLSTRLVNRHGHELVRPQQWS